MPHPLHRTAGVPPEEARGMLESAVHFMDATFKAAWGGDGGGNLQDQPARLQGGCAAGGWLSRASYMRWCSPQSHAVLLKQVLSVYLSIRGIVPP